MLVGGEAGIGKSELLRHFGSTVASRCVEFGQAPMAPWRELLAQLAQRARDEVAGDTRALIERLSLEHSAAKTSEWMPDALFGAIDAAFAQHAGHGTIVLTIEDLHWADRSTLAFLNYIADRLERRRVLIVATYRSEDFGSQHPQLAVFSALLAKRSVSTMMLAPLPDAAVRALIDRHAPAATLSATTASEIARRSQGNPFFVEELVKSALDAGSRSQSATLPLSIRAAVLARAAQLDDDQRGVLALASVLGERFAVSRLIALADGDRERVVRALERGRSLQLLSDYATAAGEVAFRHGLTQEVLYGELLAERVRPLHEAIARELESRSDGDASVAELAHHWRRAGDPEKAAVYDERAGDRAAAIGAFADAIASYERACAARPNDAVVLHKLGAALGAINELEAGIERLRRAADLYDGAGDVEGFAENAFALVALLYNRGDVGAATATCEETIATLRSRVSREAVDLFRTRLAFQCIAALDGASASAVLDAIEEPVESPRLAMHLYSNRFKIAAMRGDTLQWASCAARALDAAGRIDDGGSWVRMTRSHVALDAIGLGEMATAQEHLRAAAPPRDELSTPQSALLMAASAFSHVLLGNFSAAAELLRQRDAFVQNYPVLVHARTASFALGICSGDEMRLRQDDTAAFLHYGIERGMKIAIGLLGGPFAWALGLRGETGQAAQWIAQIAPALPTPHRFVFAYLAGAQFGEEADVAAMRVKLVAAAATAQDRVNGAVLGLFDAFAAQRGMLDGDAGSAALRSAAVFEKIGWPWFAARSYELGGDTRRALELFSALGSVLDVRRLEVERSDAWSAPLSSREREVAELVANGHSNQEISQILHISTRTAEKHVFTALKKLNLRSRVQLGQLVARSSGQPSDPARQLEAVSLPGHSAGI